MNTITTKHCPDRRLTPRINRAKIKRSRTGIQLRIELPQCPLKLHNLDDATRFKVHRYRLDPDFMAVRTSEVIEVHNLVVVGGETLKVVRVEHVADGCVEIRVLKFGRYQR